MRAEDLGSMLSVFKAGKLGTRISRQVGSPLHYVHRITVVFIVRGGCREDRPLGMIRNKVDTIHIRRTSQQHQSFHIGMALGQLNRIADTATSAAECSSSLIHARLRNQKLIGCLKVGGPLLIQLLPDLRSPSLKARAPALSKSAVIDGERVNSGPAQSQRDRLPRFPRGIAHV